MPLYEITDDSFRPLVRATFADMQVQERRDLQRLLRTQINVLGEDLYVLAEEFGDWEDSRRRIDLLAVDRKANLVVIELKRTNDGGHMDLQALRYASMVSTMTFDRAVEVHAGFLAASGQSAADARARLLEFLGWDSPVEEEFAADVRIVLASEDFGKEMTTAVLWLRDRGIDIQCMRLRPYLDGPRKLVDVQQIIPLPEAAEYQIQLREKEQVERRQRAAKDNEFSEFWGGLIPVAARQGLRHGSLRPSPNYSLAAGAGLPGTIFGFIIVKDYALVDFSIDQGDSARNREIFGEFLSQREFIESTFGEPLIWDLVEGRRSCKIRHRLDKGGYSSPRTEWAGIHESMVQAMVRLEAALRPQIERLRG